MSLTYSPTANPSSPYLLIPKIKVAAAIVAISSIHLLRALLNINEWSNDKLILLMSIHLIFVLSALLLAYLDKVSSHGLIKPQ